MSIKLTMTVNIRDEAPHIMEAVGERVATGAATLGDASDEHTVIARD